MNTTRHIDYLRPKIALILACLGAFLWLGYWAYAVYVHAVTPTISKVIVSGDNFPSPSLDSFPFFRNSLTGPGHYSFDITLFYNEEKQTSFLINPLGCVTNIQINDKPYDLSPGQNYCNKEKGFTIDLAGLLNPGSNRIDIAIEDRRGIFYGLDVTPLTPQMPSRLLTAIILIIGLLSIIGAGGIYYYKRISKDRIALVLCLFSAVALRLYSFWSRPYRDEGAFIMLGHDFLQGNLPYLMTFENKPPLVNVAYAFSLIFTDSLPGIRLIIALCIGLTAYIIYRICAVAGFPRAGVWGALFYLLLSSVARLSINRFFLIPGLTEYIASLPLALMVYYTVKPRTKSADALTGGLYGALAGLLRTNLLMVMPFVMLILLMDRKNAISARIKRIFWFGIGIVAPYILLFCVYAGIGQVKTLWDSMFIAPMLALEPFGMARSVENIPHLMKLYLHAGLWQITTLWSLWSIPIVLILAGILLTLWRRDWQMAAIFFKILAVTTGLIFSVIILIQCFEKYELQLFFPIALMLGLAVSVLLKNRLAMIPVMVFVVFMLLQIKYNIEAASAVLARWDKGMPLQTGDEYKMGEFIRQQDTKGSLFVLGGLAIVPFYAHVPLAGIHVYSYFYGETYKKLNTLLFKEPYDSRKLMKEILESKPLFIAYAEHQFDYLIDIAKNQGYENVTKIGDISLLERPLVSPVAPRSPEK